MKEHTKKSTLEKNTKLTSTGSSELAILYRLVTVATLSENRTTDTSPGVVSPALTGEDDNHDPFCA